MDSAGADPSHLTWNDLKKVQFCFLMLSSTIAIRLLLYPIGLIGLRSQVAFRHIPSHSTGASPPQSFPSSSRSVSTSTIVAAASQVSLPVVDSVDSVFSFFMIRDLIKKEGFCALYKGLAVSLVGLSTGPVYISSLEVLRQYLHDSRFLEQLNCSFLIPLISGVVGSVISQTVSMPLENISNRLALQNPGRGESPMSASATLLSVWRNEGIRGLYRGYTMTLIGHAPFSGILWLVYVPLYRACHSFFNRRFLHRFSFSRAPCVVSDSHSRLTASTNISASTTKWKDFPATAFASSLASTAAYMGASILTHPIYLIKINMQQERGRRDHSHFVVVKEAMIKRGFRGLWSGCIPRLCFVMPSGVLLMLSYEVCKRLSIKEKVDYTNGDSGMNVERQ